MTSETRHLAMLETAFGPVILAAIRAADTVEITVNPDGKLWVEKEGGYREVVADLARAHCDRIIRLVASHVGSECAAHAPIVSAELPGGGERFEGLLPPTVSAPCFSIRKPASRVFALNEYVEAGTISPMQELILSHAIESRENIVIAGGTGSGKTTFANALLQEISKKSERLVLIEDTRELQCAAEDHAALRTIPSIVSMRDLVRSALRLRPDRIIIGEVRGAEALDLLKAWNTGHPGGVTTLHANSADAALVRLEQLCGEAVSSVPRSLIVEAVDLIVFLKRTPDGRKVTELKRVTGLTSLETFMTEDVTAPALTLVEPQEINP